MDDYQEFVDRRDALLRAKPGQSVAELAEEIIRVMEEIAVHGSTGIKADPDVRDQYVATMASRINDAKKSK